MDTDTSFILTRIAHSPGCLSPDELISEVTTVYDWNMKRAYLAYAKAEQALFVNRNGYLELKGRPSRYLAQVS